MNNNSPKVSIIVPVYNVERFLDRCVESLVNQTLDDIEIILVDDLSPDNSPQMCDAWASRDHRIKVIHKTKNEGLGLARNSGLELAKGDYVAFVDSDDYVDLEMYETMYKVVSENSVDITICGLRYITINGTVRDYTNVKENFEVKGDQIYNYILDMIACAPYEKKQRKYDVSACRGLYKKEIIDSFHLCFRSEREVLSEDLVFNIQYLQHSKTLFLIPRAFYNYCQNCDSTSSVFKIKKYGDSKYLCDVILDLIGDCEETKLRVNRMFIGYLRGFMLDLANSCTPDKLSIIEQILKDSVFIRLKEEYKPSYLPSYHKELYWMQVNNQPVMTYFFVILIVKAKKFVDRIHL